MTKYAMIIDLGKCVGCSACQIACKVENVVGTGHFYSSHEVITRGSFPDVTYRYIPTMCNHCDNAACVQACPPGAITKIDGLSILDSSQCVGCGACVVACPYGFSMMREKQSYRLLFDEGEAIKGCTSSGSEISRLVASPVPYAGVEEGDKDWLLDESKAEKCNFCEQRRKQNEDPYCVHMCPANARIWGDIDDDDSDAAKVLKQQDARVSHPEYGTSPSVFYIGAFS